jgi:hypothetical protein
MPKFHPAKPLLAVPLVLVLGIGGAAAAGLGTANDRLGDVSVPSPADQVVPEEVPGSVPDLSGLPIDVAGPELESLSVEGTEAAINRIEEILGNLAPEAAETGLEIAGDAVSGNLPAGVPPVDIPNLSSLPELDDILSELPLPEPPAGPGLPEVPELPDLPAPPVGRP